MRDNRPYISMNKVSKNYNFLKVVDFVESMQIYANILTSPPVSCGIIVAQSLDFCVVFCISLLVLYMLTIVLSVPCFSFICFPLCCLSPACPLYVDHCIVCPLLVPYGQTTQWSTYKGQAGDRQYNGQHIKDKQGTDNTMGNI
jgi:hypothetical protein